MPCEAVWGAWYVVLFWVCGEAFSDLEIIVNNSSCYVIIINYNWLASQLLPSLSSLNAGKR